MGREEILPELDGNFRLCAVDQKRPFFPRAGPFLAFLPFQEAYGKAGPLREAPYGEGRSLREGPPYREGRSLREGLVLTGSPLQGWLPLQKRTAYGKLLGEILPELGGNFRLCAVDQKRPFFPRAGPFLAFLPFKEAYGKAWPLREAPYGEGRSLREGPALTGEGPLRGRFPSQKRTTKRLTGRLSSYGKPLTGRDGPYGKGRSLRKGPGCLTGPFTKKDDEEAYGLYEKGKSLTGKSPYGKGRS